MKLDVIKTDDMAKSKIIYNGIKKCVEKNNLAKKINHKKIDDSNKKVLGLIDNVNSSMSKRQKELIKLKEERQKYKVLNSKKITELLSEL